MRETAAVRKELETTARLYTDLQRAMVVSRTEFNELRQDNAVLSEKIAKQDEIMNDLRQDVDRLKNENNDQIKQMHEIVEGAHKHREEKLRALREEYDKRFADVLRYIQKTREISTEAEEYVLRCREELKKWAF